MSALSSRARRKRGAGFTGEDWVRLRLNPYNSKRGSEESELTVNALGTQNAYFAGGRALKQEWEGVWQSAARIGKEGWSVEMAIPWNVFARPSGSGQPVTLGLNFQRYQARTQMRSYWSNLGLQERRELGGEWVGVVIPPGGMTDPLSVLGYVYSGYERGRAAMRSGLDARYEVTPSLTAVGTINPDFSNVESAVTSIDFSYSERLPDERRPFFLEGGDYFSLGLNGATPFRSVRIPEIDAAAKFYGRLDNRTVVGLMGTENFDVRGDSVVQIKREFSTFDQVIVQNVRKRQVGEDNDVWAAQGKMRRGDWTWRTAYSRSTDITGSGEVKNASLEWDCKRWWAEYRAMAVSPGYRARDGYVPFTDQKGHSVSFGYDADYRSGMLRSLYWGLDAFRYRRTSGSFFRDKLTAYAGARIWNQLGVGFSSWKGRFEGNRDRVTSFSLHYPELNKFQNFSVGIGRGNLGGNPVQARDSGSQLAVL